MSPTGDQVRAARVATGLTQTQAAGLVYVKLRCWQRWEDGTRAMPGAAWELFGIKARPRPRPLLDQATIGAEAVAALNASQDFVRTVE